MELDLGVEIRTKKRAFSGSRSRNREGSHPVESVQGRTSDEVLTPWQGPCLSVCSRHMIQLDILLSHAPRNGSFAERVDWLVRVFSWLRSRSGDDKIPPERAMSVRLKYALKLMEQNPTWKETVITTLSQTLTEMSGIEIFARMGLSSQITFWQDFANRIHERVLPKAPLHEDLPSLLRELFPDEEDSLLVEGIDDEVWAALLSLFAGNDRLITHLHGELVDSAQILATQILQSALLVHMRNIGRAPKVSLWPEKKLVQFVDAMAGGQAPDITIFRSLVAQCRQEVQGAHELFEQHGVSVDQVYTLLQRMRWLDRLETIFGLLFPEPGKTLQSRRFLSLLITDLHQQLSFRTFFRDNLSLLSQRIVERNSEVGEHYVTYNWKEFRHMMHSAGGGGVITCLTVFVKILLSKVHAAGFIQGFLEGTNYALSFLTIQFAGFSLGTKQPSTTAPYLAKVLKKSVTDARKAIIAVLRTQFIAVIGNVALAFPLTLVVSWLCLKTAGPVMPVEKALATVHSTDILGPSFLFASFTGVLLFISSLIAGWFENWVLLHRLPERIENGLVSTPWLSKRRVGLANLLKSKSNALAANISLGFLLGFSPHILQFFGIPLDVRHVTLASGTLGAALPVIWDMQLGAATYTRAIMGIGMIGILNLSVSFALAFVLAAASSQVRLQTFLTLFRTGALMILRKPWLLIVPEEPSRESNPQG